MKKASLKRNLAYQMIYEILVIILPFITSPYIARVLGAEKLGEYSYSYSIAQYFVLFAMLGIKNYGNREIAAIRDNPQQLNETFSNIFFVHAIASLTSFAIYMFYVFRISGDNKYALIQSAFVLSAFFDISWFYFGIEKFKTTVARSTIIRIITVICIFTLVRTPYDLWKYCVIMALGNLISQLILWLPLRKYVKWTKPKKEQMMRHIKPLILLFIPVLAISLYTYMDKIILGMMKNKTELGYFENAEKAINIPQTIITAFGTVMLPKMSNLAASNDQQTAEYYMSISMKYIMCVAFALSFGIGGVGTVFAPVFWGKDFTASGELIKGLAITIPFLSFANIIRTQYLIPHKKDREYLISVLIGAVINLTLNLLLVPSLGAKGSMVATVFAEIGVCVVQTIAVSNKLPIAEYIKSFVPFFVFGAVMGVVVLGVLHIRNSVNLVTLILQIFCGACVYLTLTIFYLVRTKDPVFLKFIETMRKRLLKSNAQ